MFDGQDGAGGGATWLRLRKADLKSADLEQLFIYPPETKNINDQPCERPYSLNINMEKFGLQREPFRAGGGG